MAQTILTAISVSSSTRVKVGLNNDGVSCSVASDRCTCRLLSCSTWIWFFITVLEIKKKTIRLHRASIAAISLLNLAIDFLFSVFQGHSVGWIVVCVRGQHSCADFRAKALFKQRSSYLPQNGGSFKK